MQKLFIKEVEKILGVKRTTLFYWEKTGKIPRAQRTPMGNYRYWLKSDIDKVRRKLEGK